MAHSGSSENGRAPEPWARSSEEVLGKLDVSLDAGLDSAGIEERRKRYGANRLEEAKRKSAWRILVDQFMSLIIALLALAAAVSFFIGEWVDGIAVSVAILVNTVIGFVSELKAVRSMEALEELGTTTARVRRDGEVREIPSEDIVPGDIVVIESGDLVPADIRIVRAAKLEANESALTGESVPVSKGDQEVEADAPLGDRSNMLFKGTSVTKGSGEGVVVSVGMDTEVGRIASLAEEAEEEATPLERRLDRLGYRLVYAIGVVVVVIGVVGVLRGRELFLMFEVAVALAVAAIPEGLPIVATIALARGMWRMAKRNALVNRLSAVETLGSTSVIFTDKTGTLTENKMTVTRMALATGEVTVEGGQGRFEFKRNGKPVDPGEDEILREALEIGMLCNNASLGKGGSSSEIESATGDPVEVALLAVAAGAGMDRETLLEGMPEEREEPFDSDTKMMATYHRRNGGQLHVAVKGAPEAVIESCSRVRTGDGEREMGEDDRERWLDRNRELADDGLRVLALAARAVDSTQSHPYEDLTFVGLTGLWDPPRQEIRDSIASCRKAGIRVIMVTGDHAMTAGSIGEAVGIRSEDDRSQVVEGGELKDPDDMTEEERRRLLNVSIFARVSPKQKLDLIKLHQKRGAIVAMTGDGVNDAPALKKADIGVAMGQRGTQVAREAADVVLQDDAFETIARAVAMGRVIFDNIRKFVIYLLSGNVCEVLIVSIALLAGAPLPILPLQILYLNMLSDVFPALALGLGEGTERVMDRAPRDSREPIVARFHWLAIGAYSVLIGAAVLGAFALAFHWLELDRTRAVTVSFLTLAFGRLWHVFNMREHRSPLFGNDVVRNPFVWGALALCTGLLLLAVYIPTLASVLRLARPGAHEWALILGGSLAPFVVGQIFKYVPLDFVRRRLSHKAKERVRTEEAGLPEPRRKPLSPRREAGGLILAFFLLSLGGLLLHLRSHPVPGDELDWVAVSVSGANVVLLPLLFSLRATVLWAYVLTWVCVFVGAAGMAWFSYINWTVPVTVSAVILDSTLPQILILLAKLPIAHKILRIWRETPEES